LVYVKRRVLRGAMKVS